MSMMTSTSVFTLPLLCLMVTSSFADLQKPNIIVMQPDDLIFFEEWTPPAHFPTSPDSWFARNPPPNMERLRTQGLEMTQAYTASSMCGTSRYSTMTGRYPSRSAQGREWNWEEDVAWVTIPGARLEDKPGVVDGMDCSENNLAVLLKQHGYRTGVMGKWHLSPSPRDQFDYTEYRQNVRRCGWDVAEALYAENLSHFWNDGTFSHNLEYITMHAVDFIRSSDNGGQPFFLYFNPTAPHRSGDVYEALTSFNCTNTPEGTIDEAYLKDIPGMTKEYGNCEAYRKSIIERANRSDNPNTQNTLGSIWIDDAIGSLMTVLEEMGQLDNTLFLFQLDHGEEGKTTLYEPGVRIAQFIHYPAVFGTNGKTWSGLVSTIDVAPTIAAFAGIGESEHYLMDGDSWKDAVLNDDPDDLEFWRDERCLVFELYYDRAIRCGCTKYMWLWNPHDWTGLPYGDGDAIFDLCQDSTTSARAGGETPELANVAADNPDTLQRFEERIQIHLGKTYPQSPVMDFTPLV